MKHSRIYIGIAVLFAFFSSGCASQGPVLLDFQYQPPQAVSPEAAKVTVGVSPFKDNRGKVASVVGKHSFDSSNQTSDLVVQGTVADKVTAALKSALKARGIAERDYAAWNLTEAGIPSDGSDLLVSGEIKNLWVKTTSRFADTTAKAEVQIRISVADMSQRKVIRILNVNSTMERQSLTFSTGVVESALSDALTAAIDQIFADEELKNRLK